VEAEAHTLAALRQNPVPPGSDLLLPPGILKHADEQTIVSLAAVLRALPSLRGTDFTNWGVLAAPRFIGRQMFVVCLQKFCEEGAWGVSPHLIPHRSLHSVSGTISQALRIHGPNFGVGNGPAGASEGLLSSAALLAGGQVPGVWLVLSGWTPEVVDRLVKTPSSTGPVELGGAICRAAALALVPLQDQVRGPVVRVSAKGFEVPANGKPARRVEGAWLSPESLVTALTARPLARTQAFRLRCGGWMALERLDSEREN
jgi:hypothetical protein